MEIAASTIVLSVAITIPAPDHVHRSHISRAGASAVS